MLNGMEKNKRFMCVCVCVDEHAFDYPSGTGDNSLMCIACILYTNNRFRMQWNHEPIQSIIESTLSHSHQHIGNLNSILMSKQTTDNEDTQRIQ